MASNIQQKISPRKSRSIISNMKFKKFVYGKNITLIIPIRTIMARIDNKIVVSVIIYLN